MPARSYLQTRVVDESSPTIGSNTSPLVSSPAFRTIVGLPSPVHDMWSDALVASDGVEPSEGAAGVGAASLAGSSPLQPARSNSGTTARSLPRFLMAAVSALFGCAVESCA